MIGLERRHRTILGYQLSRETDIVEMGHWGPLQFWLMMTIVLFTVANKISGLALPNLRVYWN